MGLTKGGFERQKLKSGRRDLNPRPLEPHSSALPSCATARFCSKLFTNCGKSPETAPMKPIRRSKCLGLAVITVLLAICVVHAQPRHRINLNRNGLTFAAELIKGGHFLADRKGAWTKHRPSADEE